MAALDHYRLTDVKLLKDLCLNVIAQHFSRIRPMLDLAGKFYLQKTSSDSLLEILSKYEDFRFEDLDFLLNQYLKKLTIQRDWNRQCYHTMIKNLPQATALTCLVINEKSDINDLDLLKLANSLPSSLKELNLQRTRCSDAMVEIVAQNCTHLETLNLFHCHEVTDKGMWTLCSKNDILGNTVLQKLDLRHTSVEKGGIALVLEHCPNLTELYHAELLNTIFEIDDVLVKINDLSNLKRYKFKRMDAYLHLFEWPVQILKVCDTIFPFLQECGFFVSLSSQIDDLANLASLTSVNILIRDRDHTMSVSPFLQARGEKLKELSVTGGSLSIALLLGFCQNLQFLNLCDVQFENTSCLPPEYTLTKLDMLVLNGLEASGPIICVIISSCPNIETLALEDLLSLTDSNFESVISNRNFTRIRHLQLWGLDIGGSVLEKFIQISPDLEKITINQCLISPKECDSLAAMKRHLKIEMF